jgi:UDPglucose--hexose-1-phosphate uridylyltransferase
MLRLKHEIATEHFDVTSKCVYCVALAEELAAGERVLLASDDYVVVLPYASHLPYQLRILPREHQSSFGRVAPSRLGALAQALRDALLRLDRTLGAPHFNLTLGTAPIGDEDEPYFHWHIDILPRLTTPAGFELGSGMAINPVLPEEAARELQAATAGGGSPMAPYRNHGDRS